MAAPVAIAGRVLIASPKARRGVVWLFALILLVPLMFVVITVSYFAEAECNTTEADSTFDGRFNGPGSLGGVMGTGVTKSELRTARSHPYGGTSIAAGKYDATAYAPAAGGINCNSNGDCSSTAAGIRVNDGRRKVYIIASNPKLNKYGSLAYVWPNPYRWKGPFVVADTGGNFGVPGRLDFYTWGDDSRAKAWGHRNVQVSNKPLVSGGQTTDVDTTLEDTFTADGSGTSEDVASGEQCVNSETPPDGTTGYEGVVQWVNWLDKQRYPYCYGGGHVTPARPTSGSYCWSASGRQVFGSSDKGYDCSSSVSFILQHAGYKLETMATPGFVSWGKKGPGKRVTIYNKPYGAGAHVFLKIGNRFFSTSASNYRHGPGWVPASIRSTAGFAMTHPEGL